MKITNVLRMAGLAAVLSVSSVVLTGVSTAVAGDHGKHTKLEDAMSASNKAFKIVRKQAADASKNKESAKLVGKMVSQMKKGLNYEPKWTVDKPKADQKDYVASYKVEMQKSLDLLVDLQAAFKQGDNAKAEKIISDIRAHQKENHKKYKKPKPKKK